MRFTFVDRDTGLLKPVMNPNLSKAEPNEAIRVQDPNDIRRDYLTSPEPQASIADLIKRDETIKHF